MWATQVPPIDILLHFFEPCINAHGLFDPEQSISAHEASPSEDRA
jgi:hypothetical protein